MRGCRAHDTGVDRCTAWDLPRLPNSLKEKNLQATMVWNAPCSH